MKMSSIKGMIDRLNEETVRWLQTDVNGKAEFIDPLDQKEISAHYGMTHAAAAWIIWGKKTEDFTLLEKGILLLKSILERWNDIIQLPAFHFDFNNFALCVVHDYIKDDNPALAKAIENTVLRTQDSNNPTINWYPMRWHVNQMRYRWTGEQKYQNICEICRAGIQNATFADGLIDDRVPKGKSFNLQYDAATVAVLQYLRVHGEKLDLSNELAALLGAVSPDGDINYLGRGANQVFAWGLWIYLLASAECKEVCAAEDYLSARLPSMLENHSMMLNNWPGEEKYLWWDYHYCSVYTAHLLFWLVLAYEDAGKAPITVSGSHTYFDSGLRAYHTDNSQVVTFDGRSEYLAEHGPAVSLIATKRHGVIVKGCFAPWLGLFGNNHTYYDIALRNYCGLEKVETNIDCSQNRYLRKLLPDLQFHEKMTIAPVFAKVSVSEEKGVLSLTWDMDSPQPIFVNIPVLRKVKMQCLVDGNAVKLIQAMQIRNQYDWVSVYQSKKVVGKQVKLAIEL